MASIFLDLIKTVAAPGTPEALGASTVEFNVGMIYPREDNTGLVRIKQASGGSAGQFILSPGQLPPHIIENPNHTVFNAAQFYIDADVADEGVRLVYSKAEFKTFHCIEMKLESAMRNYIQTIATTIDDCTITTGLSDEGQGRDNIHCLCDEAEEEEGLPGLWRCTATIFIKTDIGKPGEEASENLIKHRLRTAYVRDLFMDGDNTTQILGSLEPNFSVQDEGIVNRKITTALDKDANKYLSRMTFEVLCCGNQVF